MSLDAVSGGLWAEGGLHFPPSFPPTPASSPSKQTLPPASSHNMPFLSFVFFQIGNKSCLWLSCSLSLLDFSNQIYIVYCTTCIVQCTLYIIQGASKSSWFPARPFKSDDLVVCSTQLLAQYKGVSGTILWFSCLWFRVVPQNRRRVEQVVRNWVRKIGQFRLRRVRATLPPFSIRCRCSAGKLGNLGRQ